MKKRAVAVLLAAVLVLSMSGCQNGTEGEKSNTQSVESESKKETENSGEKNLYGFDSEVNIKVGLKRTSDFKWYGSESAEKNQWMDLYRDNNIIPEILYDVDEAQGETKLSTAIMSGNYPDIIEAKANDYVSYAKNGVIADITDIFELYASDELKEYLNADGGLSMKSVTVDGKIYGLPRMGNGYDLVPLMFIRQDWLDNLGLKMPSTMDEFKEVAKAFTYNDPDGNGKDDTYGLAIDGTNVLSNSVGDANAIFYAYGAYPGSDGMAFIQGDDGKVTWGGTNAEGMKEGLKLLKDLYADGSLAKDFITMDGDSIFEEAGSGRCGIWFGPMWAGMVPAANAVKTDVNAHITSAPVPDGLNQGGSQTLLSTAMESVFCVSSQCENPEVLIKLMNLSVQKLCYPKDDDEYYRYYGDAENYTGWKSALTFTLSPMKNYTNYKKESVALESGDTSDLNTEQMKDYTNMKNYLDAVESGKFDPEDAALTAGLGKYSVFGDTQGSYAALDKMIQGDRFVESAYNASPTDKMADASSTLKKMTVETIVKVITGEDADSYDSFLKTWYTMGGQDVINDAQAWVDENK